MQIDPFEARRTDEGVIDVQHYARAAHAERRLAKTAVMRLLGRTGKRALATVIGLVMFWYIPPMGSVGSRDLPYR